jgi:chemotaxis protein histidine kinase CheA
MSLASFKDRLDRVRHRFVSTLEGKIDDAYHSLSDLADVTPAAATSVEVTFRSIHSVVGLGPTVGFPSTTKAARGVEEVLRGAYETQRGLTADEILLLKKQLHTLREAASRELQFFYAH